MALFAKLVDQRLLSGISYSEFDLKMPTSAPGGGATAPAVLNVRQSDALGYEYALMYRLFTKFAPYMDHIISWGVSGSGWQGSYVLFDSHEQCRFRLLRRHESEADSFLDIPTWMISLPVNTRNSRMAMKLTLAILESTNAKAAVSGKMWPRQSCLGLQGSLARVGLFFWE